MLDANGKALLAKLCESKDPDNDAFTPEKMQAAATHLNLNKQQVETIVDQIEAEKIGHRGSNGFVTIDPMMASKYLE